MLFEPQGATTDFVPPACDAAGLPTLRPEAGT